VRDSAHRREEAAHPLAVDLAATLSPGSRVLVLGAGNGRSLPPLRAAGAGVEIAAADDELLDEHAGPYDAILSTHALLHGTCESVARRVASLERLLAPTGRLYATFGSTSDPRFGTGVPTTGGGWAPASGDEAGIGHAYFDHTSLARVLEPFARVQMEQRDVAEVIGRWAHTTGEAGPSVHWFVEAQR
jgi:hypothetical protein